uniref:thioredoxin-related transmembrane protein 1-like n=1 Tax=Myxine glutinosa TaxID=7769 RepID=UPI00358E3152
MAVCAFRGWGGGVLLLFIVWSVVLGACLVSANQDTDNGGIRSISDGTWRELMEGEWLVEFYAPWCPACQQLQQEWGSLASKVAIEAINLGLAKVDVTKEPGLSGRFFITSLPTIYHAKDGEFRQFRGPRNSEELLRFVTDQAWERLDPVATWKAPSSVLMTGMSCLFQLSMWIRVTHNYMVVDLGLPVWVSYMIFALSMLLVGLLLGLIFVLLTDCICPAKHIEQSLIEVDEDDDDDDEEEEEEEEEEGAEEEEDDDDEENDELEEKEEESDSDSQYSAEEPNGERELEGTVGLEREERNSQEVQDDVDSSGQNTISKKGNQTSKEGNDIEEKQQVKEGENKDFDEEEKLMVEETDDDSGVRHRKPPTNDKDMQ